MSHAQIEQFYSRVKNDPALFNKLTEGTQTPDQFIDKAVALGAATGFTFSRTEADTWVKGQIEAKANGELSDLQLEGVAGGKGVSVNWSDCVHETVGALSNAGSTIGNWLMTW